MKAIKFSLFHVLLATTSSCFAFDVATHAAITQQAFLKFTSDLPSTMDDLGVPSLLNVAQPISIFGRSYFDNSDTIISIRDDRDFEDAIIRSRPLLEDPLGTAGWVMRGAIREDDGPLAIGSPWDDPYDSQPVNRFLNHFFDPVKNRPLTTPGLPEAVVRAPDWATGVATRLERRGRQTRTGATISLSLMRGSLCFAR